MSRRFFSLSSTSRISSFATAHRKRERERRARAHLTLYPDPTAMELYEFLAQRQPQPCALRLLFRTPHLPELLEDRLLILGRDAHAGVRHRDLRHTVDQPGPDVDPTTCHREFQRVRQKVQEDLFELAFITRDLTQARIDRVVTRVPPPHRPLAK